MLFSKKIIFSHDPAWTEYLKDVYPVPAKINIPDWYKKLKHTWKEKNIKGCMPFLDSLTSGYILKIPQDLYIGHNVDHPVTKQKDSFFQASLERDRQEFHRKINMNFKDENEIHDKLQLGKDCPYHQKNKDLPFYKILNPFKIKTPPGYSTLFVPPLNNKDDRFEIISGIVDTDTFTAEINFPIIINGDKYPVLETIFKKGTPYVQCIPFKRDKWKMEVKAEVDKSVSFARTFLQDDYKKVWWNKKTWN